MSTHSVDFQEIKQVATVAQVIRYLIYGDAPAFHILFGGGLRPLRETRADSS